MESSLGGQSYLERTDKKKTIRTDTSFFFALFGKSCPLCSQIKVLVNEVQLATYHLPHVGCRRSSIGALLVVIVNNLLSHFASGSIRRNESHKVNKRDKANHFDLTEF